MKRHYRHIDVLKGVCILIVIIEHAKWPTSVWRKALFPFWDRIAIPCFMVISGFVNSRSIENTTLSEAYKIENIIRKLKRYLIPYTVAFAIEAITYCVIGLPFINRFIDRYYVLNHDVSEYTSFSNLLKAYFSGGFGPGNYYTPVLIQLVLLFPVLVFFMDKKDEILWIVAFICFLFRF